MTQEQFNQLVLLIRKAWSKKTGLVVRLQRQEDDVRPLLMCMGSFSNPGFVAQNCKLWEADDLLYDGKINDEKLRQILTDKEICHAEISTVKRLDVNSGVYTCLGDRENCTKDCGLKNSKTAQIGSVNILIR